MLEKIALEGSKILIASQIEDDIKILQDIFTPEKYIVGTISEPNTNILTIISTIKPDLILLDLNFNGFNFCNQIHQVEKNIPVILISEQANPYEIAKGFNIGAIDYINKPFQAEEIKSRIKINLKNSKLTRELAVSKLESECILSSIIDAIISINSNGKIVYFNKIAENLFGLNSYNISRFLEMPYIKLSYNDQNLVLLDMVENALLNNSIIPIQRGTELTNMHGKTFLVKGNVSPTYNDRMRAIGVLIVIQDVTEQIQLEKTLSNAEKISTIGTLAAGFAHEINNPLSAIVHGIENIKRRINPTLEANKNKAQEYNINIQDVYTYIEQRNILKILDGIFDVGIRASNIIKNIMRLDINKPYIGCKENINDIITNRLSQINIEKNDLIETNKIHFTTQLGSNLPEITCIKNDIDFVVLSLLNNAIEAISEYKLENPTIEVQSDATPTHINIKICDFGKKISNKIISHMFDPFYTSTPTRTGLGLFVSYFIIVNKHHGTIQYLYDHKQNKNVFTISLPIH
jgi:PAS domain S-box-containing protein